MNRIRRATTDDLRIIQTLAHHIWWPTYSGFLPHAQIEKMLAEFYTPNALEAQMLAGHQFALWESENAPAGFVGFRALSSPAVMRVEKLYISPQLQGFGAGKGLLQYVAQAARGSNINLLELNVNRDNPAVSYYLRQGFAIIKEVDIPYPPYILNDYVMQKDLSGLQPNPPQPAQP